jgi:hypothetical protein
VKITQFSPRVYEDETIYSIAARAVLNDISGTVAQGIENITGSRNIQLDAQFPSYLVMLSDYTGIEFNDLIRDFSLIPYFSLFAPEQARCNAIHALQNGNSIAAFKSLGLLASRINESKYHRFCPECAVEQKFTYGEAFWLKHHQLPLVSVCTSHNCFLEQLPRKRKTLVFPNPQIRPKPNKDEVSLKLADISKSIMGLPPFDLPKLRMCYAVRLIEKKLATIKSINVSGLRGQLRDYYKNQAFGCDALALLNNNDDHGYPANLFYSKQAAHHPIKHLLLITFLFDHFGDFIVSYSNMSQLEKRALPASKPVSKSTIDDKKRRKVIVALNSGKSLRQTMRIARVGAPFVRSIADSIGVPIEHRAPKLSSGLHRAIVIKLMYGLSIMHISVQLECKKSDVENVLTGLHSIKLLRKKIRFYQRRKIARKTISIAITNSSIASIKKLKDEYYKDYMWAYKNDKKWFVKNIEELKNKVV